MTKNPDTFSAPWLLTLSFLTLGAAIFEKALNLFDMSIPIVTVYPRQLLDWAVALAILEIALTVRQILETKVRAERAG
ncbi:hypothetical protein [Gaopeijia maritima]|uniref:hypothetical protein n=1 Tax=Gaopeijia maritima TaxID=3119007 RepID=UPI0032821756